MNIKMINDLVIFLFQLKIVLNMIKFLNVKMILEEKIKRFVK